MTACAICAGELDESRATFSLGSRRIETCGACASRVRLVREDLRDLSISALRGMLQTKAPTVFAAMRTAWQMSRATRGHYED